MKAKKGRLGDDLDEEEKKDEPYYFDDDGENGQIGGVNDTVPLSTGSERLDAKGDQDNVVEIKTGYYEFCILFSSKAFHKRPRGLILKESSLARCPTTSGEGTGGQGKKCPTPTFFKKQLVCPFFSEKFPFFLKFALFYYQIVSFHLESAYFVVKVPHLILRVSQIIGKVLLWG